MTDTRSDGATTANVKTSAVKAVNPRKAGPDRSAGRSKASTILVTGILVIVALYFIVPIYWVLVAATKTSQDLFSTFGFWFAPNFVLWENLGKVLTYDDGIFIRWFLNSVLYAGVGAVLATYFAAAGGYALAKYQFKGNNAVFGEAEAAGPLRFYGAGAGGVQTASAGLGAGGSASSGVGSRWLKRSAAATTLAT